MRSRTDAHSKDWLTVSYVLGGLLLLYYLVPVLSLVVAQSPTSVVGRFDDPDVIAAAANSLFSASVSTVLSTAFGLPLAYWLARTGVRWRGIVMAIVVMPLVLPPIVSGMVLLVMVGPNATLGRAATAVGVPLTRSFAGIVLAQTFVASPFVVVTATAAFEGVDRQLEEASRSLGKSRSETFRRVTLPLAWPGILAGTTLTFARSMGEFGATLMLAYYPRTMPVQIWTSFTTLGVRAAYPLGVLLVAVSIAALAALRLLGTNPWE